MRTAHTDGHGHTYALKYTRLDFRILEQEIVWNTEETFASIFSISLIQLEAFKKTLSVSE